MIKRIIVYVVISSLISAGLLYLGITMMGQYSPARASSLNALVAQTKVQNSPKTIIAADNVPLTVDQSGDMMKLEVSSLPNSASKIPVEDELLKTLENSIAAGASDTDVMIARLFDNTDLFRNRVITITGIATSLGDDKVLLNDGTGQILVEFEDDLIGLAVINGLPITVVGTLDDTSNQSSFELDACALTDQNGTVFFDDCIEDDPSISDDDCDDDDNINDYDDCDVDDDIDDDDVDDDDVDDDDDDDVDDDVDDDDDDDDDVDDDVDDDDDDDDDDDED